MPLAKGAGHIGDNYKAEMAAGKPRKQAIAIALDVDRRSNPRSTVKPRPATSRRSSR